MNNAVSLIYRVGARSVLPTNWHGYDLCLPDSKFYYVEKGEIIVEIYEKTIVAGPGDLLLIPANVRHSCRLTEDRFAVKSWCHFSLKQGANDFFDTCAIPPVLSVKDKALVSRLFRQLFAADSLPPGQRDLAATAAICGLVQYYFDHTQVVYRDASTDRIRQVIAYIDQHYAETVTLEQLARLVNYSPAMKTATSTAQCPVIPACPPSV